jgi:hypothetical protein
VRPRPRRGRLEIRLALVDLRALLQRMCVNHRAMARVPLLWDVDGSVPRLVITDPLRVQQIVANGVTNSCKHTARGNIRVSAHVEGAGVGRTLVVVVEDTGPGLSKPAEALFEPFVTGRSVPAAALLDSAGKVSQGEGKRYTWLGGASMPGQRAACAVQSDAGGVAPPLPVWRILQGAGRQAPSPSLPFPPLPSTSLGDPAGAVRWLRRAGRQQRGGKSGQHPAARRGVGARRP